MVKVYFISFWQDVIAYIHVLCEGAMPHNRLWDLVNMYVLTQINTCANGYNSAYAHTHVRSSPMHACPHDDVMQWKQFLYYSPFVRESEINCWIPSTKGRWYELFVFLCLFDASPNKLLNKHSIDRSFEMPWRLLDVTLMHIGWHGYTDGWLCVLIYDTMHHRYINEIRS